MNNESVIDDSSNLIAITGWAFDAEIFTPLDLPSQAMIVSGTNPTAIKDQLETAIQKQESTVLLGWSLGSTLALQLAAKYPDKISKLILFSVRMSYSQDEIAQQKESLLQDRTAHLEHFYRRTFAGQRKDYQQWKVKLLVAQSKFSNEDLLAGLDFLATNPINGSSLTSSKVTIIQGEKDIVAPLQELPVEVQQLEGSSLISVQRTGHLPFLNKHFLTSLWPTIQKIQRSS